MGFRSPALLFVLILIVIVLFGSSKLPDVARAVGESLKILKKDVKDMREDETPKSTPGASSAPTPDQTPGVTLPGSPGQGAPLPTPIPDPQPEPRTPDVATPDVVEGDDSKS